MKDINWGLIATVGAIGVAGFILLNSASDAIASTTSLVDELDKSPEGDCNSEAIKAADAAAAKKSWFKSRSKVWEQTYATVNSECLKAKRA